MSIANKIHLQVEAEFSCSCEATVIAVRVCTNGKKQYVRQCLTCGKCSSTLKMALLTYRETSLALPVNQDLQKSWYEARSNRQAELWASIRERENLEWWRRYNAYLQSEKWRDKSRRVLERDEYLCQACRKRRASQAHHLNYEHVFDEPLFDLIAVCVICHEFITKMDREKRQPLPQNEDQGAMNNGQRI